MSGSLAKAIDDTKRNTLRSEMHPFTHGSARGSGPGTDRWHPYRDLTRSQPYVMPSWVAVRQQQDVLASEYSSRETGTKLYLSNLDYDVTNQDIKLLFSDAGELKSYGIHYDKSGRSRGTAEVVFWRETDAFDAIRMFGNGLLDGKPLKIELVGVNFPAPPPPTSYGALGIRCGFCGSGAGLDTHGEGGGSGFARSRGRRESPQEKLSAKDLDDDLAKYHLRAK